MTDTVNVSPFMGTFMTILFVFSTLYTLAFFYYDATNETISSDSLSDDANDPFDVSTESEGVFGFLIRVADGVLEFLSWISPFGLLKGLIVELMTNTPELYQVINMLILRPVGWIVVVFEVNYILSKIPTVSGES